MTLTTLGTTSSPDLYNTGSPGILLLTASPLGVFMVKTLSSFREKRCYKIKSTTVRRPSNSIFPNCWKRILTGLKYFIAFSLFLFSFFYFLISLLACVRESRVYHAAVYLEFEELKL